MVAIPLIFGRLTANDYENKVAMDPRIDALREKIHCVEDANFTVDYLDPDKRSIANAITVEFNDGKILEEVMVEFPIGHKRRRKDGIPLLIEKFKINLNRQYEQEIQEKILDFSLDLEKLKEISVNDYVDLYTKT